MNIAADLQRVSLATFSVLGIGCCLLLVVLAASHFVLARLTGRDSAATTTVLLRAEKYLPASASLQATLAESLRPTDLSAAESHAMQAVKLAPDNHKYRLTLASIKEDQGDFRAAEESLRQAAELAPYNAVTRLRLAKFLGDHGRVAEAVTEFRRATVTDHASLETSLDYLWQITKGDVQAVIAATNDDSRSRYILANFLLKQHHPVEATLVFGEIKDRTILDSSEGATFLNSLMTAGELTLTHVLWLKLVGAAEGTLVWNGSFEEDPFRNFTHFDWTLEPSEFARVAIDPNSGHTGSRSLRLDFLGRDTAVLRNEIRQLVLLEPGVRYRLQGYAKTDGVIMAPGPRIVATAVKGSLLLAATPSIAEGANGWQLLTADFTTP
ncbi:MAG TPA: tetratricopeptide repeat protein, partial [Pyrinomonadaceae bacterium]|nr:tetratricopeptide repeat protein [Pyrinomonadaceae bacterium]